jgi:hypothetical protein
MSPIVKAHGWRQPAHPVRQFNSQTAVYRFLAIDDAGSVRPASDTALRDLARPKRATSSSRNGAAVPRAMSARSRLVWA